MISIKQMQGSRSYEERKYSKILVAIDGSDSALHAAEHAAISAMKWDASLILLTVVASPPSLYTDLDGTTISNNIDYESDLLKLHIKILEKMKTHLEEKYPKLDISTQIKKGPPAREILKVSENEEIDLIVIGNRGLGGLTGWLLGSVSNYVVNHCKKPILVIK
jgi:nucleotide-binding universal stress UspA family protein